MATWPSPTRRHRPWAKSLCRSNGPFGASNTGTIRRPRAPILSDRRREYSIRAQYLLALAAARRTIYIEDQALGAPEFVEALHDALGRGVEVVVLLPVDPNDEMAASRTDPRATPFWERLHTLGDHERFTLAGIARNGDKPGDYQNAYVHAKIALIDDAWATIGSANIANRSFYGDTELNASLLGRANCHRTATRPPTRTLRTRHRRAGRRPCAEALRSHRPRERRTAQPMRTARGPGLCARPSYVRHLSAVGLLEGTTTCWGNEESIHSTSRCARRGSAFGDGPAPAATALVSR